MESTYKILMMISAVVLILLSVILATNKLPKTPRFRKVRMTQVLLIIAFSSLGIMNILCFIKGYHPEIESFITLIISLLPGLFTFIHNDSSDSAGLHQMEISAH